MQGDLSLLQHVEFGVPDSVWLQIEDLLSKEETVANGVSAKSNTGKSSPEENLNKQQPKFIDDLTPSINRK